VSVAKANKRRYMTIQLNTIYVVVPMLNAAAYINDSLSSLIFQAGKFFLRLHIQDGGSTDGSIGIAREWKCRLEEGSIPVLCKGVSLTIDSSPDRGLYDAIAKGFEYISYNEYDLMTWLGADDRLFQGALATVTQIFSQNSAISFLTGTPTLIDTDGAISHKANPAVFPQLTLRMGMHDNRIFPFVQQEGTFWRPNLYWKVGGVDRKFHLAGDWDLWRRFAKMAELYTIDAHLGAFRQRPNQASANLKSYYGEIDLKIEEISALLAGIFTNSNLYKDAFQSGQRNAAFLTGRILVRDAHDASWRIESREVAPLSQTVWRQGIVNLLGESQEGADVAIKRDNTGYAARIRAADILSRLEGLDPGRTAARCGHVVTEQVEKIVDQIVR
jgi:glycosyltransferase involved in cell wall biosynthesis